MPQLTDTYARDAIHRDEEVSCSVSFTNSNTGALYSSSLYVVRTTVYTVGRRRGREVDPYLAMRFPHSFEVN